MRAGDLALLNTARAFARGAAPLKDQFIAYSLPDSFLNDLEHAMTGFDDACRDREAGTDAHVAARAALATEMKKAMSALRRLDAAVVNRLAHQPTTLAVWSRARRVAPQRKSRSSYLPAVAA
jgi:hypothetical protein